MKTFDPSFSSVAQRNSVTSHTEDDLLSMKTYQLALINTLMYEEKREAKKKKLLAEINRVEAWLKKQWYLRLTDFKPNKIFVNGKFRAA